MWRNGPVLEFVEWLREHNRARKAAATESSTGSSPGGGGHGHGSGEVTDVAFFGLSGNTTSTFHMVTDFGPLLTDFSSSVIYHPTRVGCSLYAC